MEARAAILAFHEPPNIVESPVWKRRAAPACRHALGR